MRYSAITAALAVTVATTALAASRFHDPKLDSADLAVEKALLLLQQVACGNPGEKTTDECERLVRKTINELEQTRALIAAAAAAADGVSE